jgi:uncharacterized membrane protein
MEAVMFFLLLSLVFSALVALGARLFGRRLEARTALRLGLAAGFVFTGVDHFVHAEARYVPMIPDALAGYAVELVHLSGLAELLGALGLALPLGLYRRLGLPDLRWWAGVGLAVLLVAIVPANIKMALAGQAVDGLDAGAAYVWLRPLLQPAIIAWALYAGGALAPRRALTPHRAVTTLRSSQAL